MNKAQEINETFREPNLFKKILIGGLINIIPVASFAIIGYIIQAAQNIAAGKHRPLPEWNEFYTFWRQGFKVWLASLPYFLPSIIVSALSSSILLRQMPALIQAWQTQTPIQMQWAPADLRTAEVLLWFVGFFCVMPAFLRYLETNQISVFWQVRANFVYFYQRIDIIWELILLCVAWFLITAVGIFLFGFGIILTGGFAYLVISYFFGRSLLQSPVVVDETHQIDDLGERGTGAAANTKAVDWTGMRSLTWVITFALLVILAVLSRTTF